MLLPLTVTAEPTVMVVPSGWVSVKVMVPVGLSPSAMVAESLRMALPTTPSAVSDAWVLIVGLALGVLEKFKLPGAIIPCMPPKGALRLAVGARKIACPL